ncbi:hypothetical protein Tco_0888316 [Tanacetum coccineum]
MLADSKTSVLSTFESVSAFRRNTKAVRNVVLLCREDAEVDFSSHVPQLSSLLRRLWIVSVILIFGLDQGIDAIDGLDGTERGYQRLCLGYAGNPNNNNGWIEADVPLLGELGDEGDKPMVGPVVDEIVEPIVEMEEQVIAQVIDIEEDIAVLFGDGDFSDDDSEGFEDEEEVWEVNEEWLMAPVTPPLMPVMPLPSTYEVGGPSTAAVEGQSFTLPAPGFLVPPSVIEDLRTRMVNLKYGHGQLVKKVIQVSDVVVADDITIGEIGSRVSAVEGQVQVMASQIVQARVDSSRSALRWRRVSRLRPRGMSRESTLMQCILRMDRRLADLEKRPPGPQ